MPSSRPTLRIGDSLLEDRLQSQRFPQPSNTSSPSADLQTHVPMGKRSCPNRNSFLTHPSGPCPVINCICRKRMYKNHARVFNHKGGTVIRQQHYDQDFNNSSQWLANVPNGSRNLSKDYPVNRLREWGFNSLSKVDASHPHCCILLAHCWSLHRRKALRFEGMGGCFLDPEEA